MDRRCRVVKKSLKREFDVAPISFGVASSPKSRGAAKTKLERRGATLGATSSRQDDAAWELFTPVVVRDGSLCLARTWGSGKGGQCGAKPKADTDFCERHSTEEKRTHGVVTEAEIPEAALRKFKQAAKVVVLYHIFFFPRGRALRDAPFAPKSPTASP